MRATRKKRRASKSVVYFALDRETDLVKVGTSTQVSGRIDALQVGNGQALELIGVIRGGAWEEGIMHEALESMHVRGEWFRIPPTQLEAIRVACEQDAEDEMCALLSRSIELVKQRKAEARERGDG